MYTKVCSCYEIIATLISIRVIRGVLKVQENCKVDIQIITTYSNNPKSLTPQSTIQGQSRGPIKYTKSDYVIKRRYKWAPTRWPASDTGWLGIPGLRLGCERSADRNPGEPFICSAPIWRERGENRKSVRVMLHLCKF